MTPGQPAEARLEAPLPVGFTGDLTVSAERVDVTQNGALWVAGNADVAGK